jgi:hypothetical protein
MGTPLQGVHREGQEKLDLEGLGIDMGWLSDPLHRDQGEVPLQ